MNATRSARRAIRRARRRILRGRKTAGHLPSAASSAGSTAVESGTPVRSRACDAPLKNLYFSATGEVGPCWIQLGGVERWSPDRSIRDIWTGRTFEAMRRAHADGRFPGRCRRCEDDIDQGISP